LEEDVKAMLMQWFQQQITEFFVEGIYWVMSVGCLWAVFASMYSFCLSNPQLSLI
jgi:hypothetical protein